MHELGVVEADVETLIVRKSDNKTMHRHHFVKLDMVH